MTHDYRLVIEQDEQAEGPIEWGAVGVIRTARVLLTGGWQDHTPESGDDDLNLVEVGNRMVGERGYGGLASSVVGDDHKVFTAIQRYAAIFLNVAIERWHPQGYTQSAWGDGIVWLEEPMRRDEYGEATVAQQRVMLNDTIKDLDAWYRGDVYVVALERRVSWVREDMDPDSADRMSTWETVEALGGCYLNDDYTAATVAAEYFQADGEEIDWSTLPVKEPN